MSTVVVWFTTWILGGSRLLEEATPQSPSEDAENRGSNRYWGLPLTAVAVLCFAIMFVYSYTHEGPPRYRLSGYRIIGFTPLWGAALLCSVVSLYSQLRAKK